MPLMTRLGRKWKGIYLELTALGMKIVEVLHGPVFR